MAKIFEAAKKELRPLDILSLLKKKFSSLCDVCMRETEHARTHTHTHTHTHQAKLQPKPCVVIHSSLSLDYNVC